MPVHVLVLHLVLVACFLLDESLGLGMGRDEIGFVLKPRVERGARVLDQAVRDPVEHGAELGESRIHGHLDGGETRVEFRTDVEGVSMY